MVLVLSRGKLLPEGLPPGRKGWSELHRELDVSYCRLVTICYRQHHQTNEGLREIGAHQFPPFRRAPVIRGDLDIVEYTIPSTIPHDPSLWFVLEFGLVIHKIYNVATGSSAGRPWGIRARIAKK